MRVQTTLPLWNSCHCPSGSQQLEVVSWNAVSGLSKNSRHVGQDPSNAFERQVNWKLFEWYRIHPTIYSVRSRLQSEQGLTFTEFTYQLLQAYDFQTLHQTHQCTIQIGGSDQWGNIVAGIELISKSASTSEPFETRAFGITTPLLVSSSGEKFGKSAGNAVWIDKDRTSIFDFYQVSWLLKKWTQ